MIPHSGPEMYTPWAELVVRRELINPVWLVVTRSPGCQRCQLGSGERKRRLGGGGDKTCLRVSTRDPN